MFQLSVLFVPARPARTITQCALRTLRNRIEIALLCSSEHRMYECTSMKSGRGVISAVLIWSHCDATERLGRARVNVFACHAECSPSNGVPARRIHLHCLRAIQNVRGHQSAVFGKSVGT